MSKLTAFDPAQSILMQKFIKRAGLMKKMSVVAIALLLLGIVQSGQAQSQNPIWIDDLKLQLLINIQCEADYFLNIYEYDGPNGLTQKARVQCGDGRRFDATRIEPETVFEIEACGNQVCDIKGPSKTRFKAAPVPGYSWDERSGS